MLLHESDDGTGDMEQLIWEIENRNNATPNMEVQELHVEGEVYGI